MKMRTKRTVRLYHALMRELKWRDPEAKDTSGFNALGEIPDDEMLRRLWELVKQAPRSEPWDANYSLRRGEARLRDGRSVIDLEFHPSIGLGGVMLGCTHEPAVKRSSVMVYNLRLWWRGKGGLGGGGEYDLVNVPFPKSLGEFADSLLKHPKRGKA
jgi:hypothetical protein